MQPQAPHKMMKAGPLPPSAPGHNHGPSPRSGRGFGHGPGLIWPATGPNRHPPMPNVSSTARSVPRTPPLPPLMQPELEVQIINDNVEPFKGPMPGKNLVPVQYMLQQHIRSETKTPTMSLQVEEVCRIQGIQAIDKVRKALHLPVRTFDTATCYFHRLRFASPEKYWNDAAMAALFVACKVEDTMKKSRDILCAAHNLNSTDHSIAPDDKSLNGPSANIIALERVILETIGFNFRVRHPQRHLAKLCRIVIPKEDSTEFFKTAYDVLMDMYKTSIPIKQSTYTMAITAIEMTSRILGNHAEAAKNAMDQQLQVERADVVESMLDLLDLYTQHHKLTILGERYGMEFFLGMKISINEEVDANKDLDRFGSRCKVCDAEVNLATPASPGPGNSGRANEDTIRFLFSVERAKAEAAEVESCTKDVYEEYEEENEVPIDYPAPGPAHGNGRRRDRGRQIHGPPSGPAGHDTHWHPYAGKERPRRGGGRKLH